MAVRSGDASAASTPARPTVAPGAIGELETAFQSASTVIAPSVVSITSARPIEDEVPEFLRPFTAPGAR